LTHFSTQDVKIEAALASVRASARPANSDETFPPRPLFGGRLRSKEIALALYFSFVIDNSAKRKKEREILPGEDFNE